MYRAGQAVAEYYEGDFHKFQCSDERVWVFSLEGGGAGTKQWDFYCGEQEGRTITTSIISTPPQPVFGYVQFHLLGIFAVGLDVRNKGDNSDDV